MKAILRALGFMAFLFAFILLVVDGTTIISAKSLSYTSLGELVSRIVSPGALERWGAAISRSVHPLFWSALNTLVLGAPAVIATALLGVLAMLGGSRTEPELNLSTRD